jgi:hypothetical protein
MKLSHALPSSKTIATFFLGFVSAFVFIAVFGYLYGGDRKNEIKKPTVSSNEVNVSIVPICKELLDFSVVVVDKYTKNTTDRQVRLFNKEGRGIGTFDVEYNKFNGSDASAYYCRYDKDTHQLMIQTGGGEIGLYSSETVVINISSDSAMLANRIIASIDNNGSSFVQNGAPKRLTGHGLSIRSNNHSYFLVEETGVVKDQMVPVRVVLFEEKIGLRGAPCNTVDECAQVTTTLRVVKDVTVVSPIIDERYYTTEFSIKNKTSNSADVVFELTEEIIKNGSPTKSPKPKIIFSQKVEL